MAQLEPLEQYVGVVVGVPALGAVSLLVLYCGDLFAPQLSVTILEGLDILHIF